MAEPARGEHGMALGRPRLSTRQMRLRRVLPFVATVAGAVGLAALPPGDPSRFALLGLASAGFLATTAIVVAVSWDDVPHVVRLLPVATFCASVALVREAAPDNRSAFAVLLILVVVLQAVDSRAREVTATVVVVFATMAIPIVVVGSPDDPASEWRGVLLLTVTVALVGATVQRLARELRREQALVAAVARLGRPAADDQDPRQSLCEASLDVTGAQAAVLLEPDGEHLRVTAATSPAIAPGTVVDLRPGAALRAARHEGLVQLEGGADQSATESPLAALGLTTWAHQPAGRAEEVQVVLSVGWDERELRPRSSVLAALDLLAAEAAAAIDRADLLDRLDRMARHDVLTGLVNRRAWDDLIEREVARCSRAGRPLSVALIDLDRFKAFNDLYGHLIGDQLLKAAAGVWLDTLRVGDVLCRWGGEEFAVLMPDTPASEARAVLARLAAATPMGQTVSGGFVTHVGPITPESLMTGADQAVYRAKSDGRARIEQGEPAPVVTLTPPVPLDRALGGEPGPHR